MPGQEEGSSPSDDAAVDAAEEQHPEGQPPPYPMPPLPSYTPGHYRRRASTPSRHRYRTYFRFKRKESNMLGAVCNMVVLVTLCSAMAEPQWFVLSGGGCSKMMSVSGNTSPVNYLGVSDFMAAGQFRYTSSKHSTTHSAYTTGTVLKDCVTNIMVNVMKIIIMLGFLAIIMSFIAFLADLMGPTVKYVKQARRNAVFSITTLILCIVMDGLCYWFSEELESFQTKTRLHPNSKATVNFSVGMYLVTAAAAVSVLATALNLMKRHGSSWSCCRRTSSRTPHIQPSVTHEPSDHQQLLSDYDGMDDVGMGRLQFYPPPPPYTTIPQEPI